MAPWRPHGVEPGCHGQGSKWCGWELQTFRSSVEVARLAHRASLVVKGHGGQMWQMENLGLNDRSLQPGPIRLCVRKGTGSDVRIQEA